MLDGYQGEEWKAAKGQFRQRAAHASHAMRFRTLPNALEYQSECVTHQMYAQATAPTTTTATPMAAIHSTEA